MEEESTSPSSESHSSTGKSQKGITTIIAIVIIGLLVVGGVIVYGMNKSKSPSNESNSSTEMMKTTPEATATPEAMDEGDAMKQEEGMMKGQTVEVTGQNFSFSPNKINVTKGVPVTIVFKSMQGFHDFVVDDLNVKTPVIQTGQDAKVTFTPTKAGTFEFYCSVGNHKAMGMVGTLVVK